MKVFLDPRLGSVQELIAYSDTLVSVCENFSNTEDYRSNARLPVDFRKLDELEASQFTSSLDELSIDDELNFCAIFPCDPHSDESLAFSPFVSLSPVSVLNTSVDQANSPSITLDRVSGFKIGLHLDSWDEHDVDSRWKSRNRIVVNRGPADRYVYLVMIPIEEMAWSIGSLKDIHPCEVAAMYLARSESPTPTLRILQRPDVAYVVSTERIVHDARVCPRLNQAESRHYLGHFVKP